MKTGIEIFEVVDEKGMHSWDVRVEHAEHHRHGGKLIANCPTQMLAQLVVDGICMLILEEGIHWDTEFEVTKQASKEVKDGTW